MRDVHSPPAPGPSTRPPNGARSPTSWREFLNFKAGPSAPLPSIVPTRMVNALLEVDLGDERLTVRWDK